MRPQLTAEHPLPTRRVHLEGCGLGCDTVNLQPNGAGTVRSPQARRDGADPNLALPSALNQRAARLSAHKHAALPNVYRPPSETCRPHAAPPQPTGLTCRSHLRCLPLEVTAKSAEWSALVSSGVCRSHHPPRARPPSVVATLAPATPWILPQPLRLRGGVPGRLLPQRCPIESIGFRTCDAKPRPRDQPSGGVRGE